MCSWRHAVVLRTDLPLLRLFLAFLRLGATAYGGPAMMAHLRRECVERRQWLTEHEFKEGMALCQAIPGATMVQMATYVGYRMGRLRGALAAAAAFCLPAFLLMTGLSAAYFHFGELPRVRGLFRGLAPVVVAIILNAILSLGRISIHDWREVTLAIMAFGALALRVGPVPVLVGAAVLSLILFRAVPRAPGTAQRIDS